MLSTDWSGQRLFFLSSLTKSFFFWFLLPRYSYRKVLGKVEENHPFQAYPAIQCVANAL